MSDFWKVVYGPETMTVTFIVQSTIEDLDTEVQRVLKLKGIRSAGPGVLQWSAETVPCPSGEWSGERYEAVRQLELEYNIFLHELSKQDADEALKETMPLGFSPAQWMELRAAMRTDHQGLTGDDGQEYRFIQDVYEAKVKLEEFDRNRGY